MTLALDAAWTAPPLYPVCIDRIPPWLAVRGSYRARFARTRDELEAIQRLRYRVFNLELGEGLAASSRTGRDADAFDETSHHILVTDDRSRVAVGTYRLATLESASCGFGFYSAQEFDLDALPASVLARSVELGRACIAEAHRGHHVLALLFEGIAAYAAHNRKRFLFGCTSLPASAAVAADALTHRLREQGSIDAALAVRPRRGFEAPACDPAVAPPALPPLLRRYLRLGARLAAEPAFDRAFGTLDYFTFLDLERSAAG